MDGFVTAYSKANGKKQRVPEHYLNHPVLGANLTLTPQVPTGEAYPEGAPSADWTSAQLQAYADAHDVDLTGSKASKADMVAAIATALTSDGTEPSDETPA